MGTKLYIGNLAFSVTEEAIHELLSQHGTVDSCQLIMDRETGRSKGFAFVQMSSDEDAKNAISSLDGQELEGRALKVNEARPPAPRSGGFSRGGGSGSRFGGGNDRGDRSYNRSNRSY